MCLFTTGFPASCWKHPVWWFVGFVGSVESGWEQGERCIAHPFRRDFRLLIILLIPRSLRGTRLRMDCPGNVKYRRNIECLRIQEILDWSEAPVKIRTMGNVHREAENIFYSVCYIKRTVFAGEYGVYEAIFWLFLSSASYTIYLYDGWNLYLRYRYRCVKFVDVSQVNAARFQIFRHRIRGKENEAEASFSRVGMHAVNSISGSIPFETLDGPAV